MMQRLLLILFLLLGVTGAYAQQNAEGLAMPFFRNISAQEYQGHNRNFDIECERKGQVFVANFEGLLVYDKVKWRMFHTPGISRITSLYRDPDDVIWFGGHNVLGRVYGGTLNDSLRVEYLACDTLKSVNFGGVERIYALPGGEIGFCTDTGQTYAWRQGKVVPHTDNYEQVRPKRWHWETNEILDSVHTEDGSIYMGSSQSGLIMTNRNMERRYDLQEDEGLCSGYVNALAYDGVGTVWGATDNGLFYVSTSQVFTYYKESENLHGQVNAILHLKGKLYVGTLQGLYRLDNGRFERIASIRQSCWQLLDLPDGGVLAATAQGIFEISAEGQVKQLTDRHALSLFRFDNGILLSGELDGIYRLAPGGGWKRIASIANVTHMRKSEKGDVEAINLQGETFRMRASNPDQFEPAEGLDMSLLLSYVDEQGRCWEPNAEGIGLTCDRLSEQARQWLNPLQRYNIQAICVKDDILWLGVNFGLLRVDLKRCESQPTPLPRLIIRSFHPGRHTVTLSFANDRMNPLGTTRYSYRFHEKDEWSDWSTNTDLSFRTHTFGSYNLQVRSIDAYGNVVESAPFHFEVPYPFYFKWYAWLFYILALVYLFNVFSRLRMKRVLRRQHELEAVVDERTRELREAQHKLIRQERESTVGKLTRGLIDRILNPLNYINNFSQLTLGLSKDLKEDVEEMMECDDTQSEEFQDLTDDCKEVLGMMNVNLNKISEHGSYTTRILKSMEELLKERSLEQKPANLTVLLRQGSELVAKYHAQTLGRLGMQVEWQLPEEPVEITCVEDSLLRVVLNLLSNSLYAVARKVDKGGYANEEKPLVRVTLAIEVASVELRIWDNGVGIEDTIQEKVFDPFFTTKPTAEAPGIGLYLSKQIILDHNGTIRLDSVKDAYTEFTITLPKN